MTCNKCKVSSTCPSVGSSPLVIGGKTLGLCGLIGGYGKTPVDTSILSKESLEASRRDGECLTFANVPQFDKDANEVVYKIVKVFGKAVTHDREKTELCQDGIIPKNHI